MKSIHKITTLGLTLYALCNFSMAAAGSPVWTFTPLTPTTIQVPANSSATIQYVIKNVSPLTHTLQLKPIAGITQNTTAGHCGNPFVLPTQAQCVLSLQVNGDLLTGNVIGGPVVCQNGSDLMCYQPSSIDILKITHV
jgi:hypothetical protein